MKLTGSIAQRLATTRTHVIDGTTWYEARDIGECFGLRNAMIIRKHIPATHRRRIIVQGYRRYEKLRITLIDAAGVYQLAIKYSAEGTKVVRDYLEAKEQCSAETHSISTA